MHPWPSFPRPHLLHLRLAASQDVARTLCWPQLCGAVVPLGLFHGCLDAARAAAVTSICLFPHRTIHMYRRSSAAAAGNGA